MTEQTYSRYNTLVEEISRDPLSADLLFTIFASQVGTGFEDKSMPHPEGKTVEEIIQTMPSMQQLANYSTDEHLTQAIGADAAKILHFAILDSPSAYKCLSGSEEIASLSRQNPTENQPKCYQFKAIQSPPGKELIFQAIKSKFNSSRYLWHCSPSDRYYYINQINKSDTNLYEPVGIYGINDTYFASSSDTVFHYSPAIHNKYLNSQLGKEITITFLFEVVNLPDTPSGIVVQINNQNIRFSGDLKYVCGLYKLSFKEACIIRYLFVNLDANVDLENNHSLLGSLK